MSANQPALHDASPGTRIRARKSWLMAVLYFFFNGVFLPKGLLYTTIAAPLFYMRLLSQGKRVFAKPFFLFLLSFAFIHLLNGVNLLSFFVSNSLFVLVYFFTVAAWHFINSYARIGELMKVVLVVNSFMVLVALFTLLLPRPQQEWMWYFNKITRGFENFPRLAMFTYEASYYALLFAPVAFYYILKFVLGQIGHARYALLALAVVPMLLSLSFGVIGAACLTALLMSLIFVRRIYRRKRAFTLLVSVLVLLAAVFVALALWFPDNVIFARLQNIFSGSDTSAKGRTFDSFVMAWRVAETKSIWFGAGLGQVKFVVVDVVHRYFSYWGDFPRFDIPNAMGETLAIFGIAGVALRLGVELWLFSRTGVSRNYYRLAIFIFVFIYQFTGSFITNSVEYLLWAIAFSNGFVAFDTAAQSPVSKG